MKKGFTLIELMVVVMIIGLLSGAVIVNVNKARQDSRDAKRLADLANVSSALQQYYTDNRSFPGASGLTLAEKYSAVIGALSPQYIASTPTDPLGSGQTSACSSGSATYEYRYSIPDPQTYYLIAQIENQNMSGLAYWNSPSRTGCKAYILKNGEQFIASDTNPLVIAGD